MLYDYYPLRGLNLSKNPYVSCVTIDLTTTHILNYCHKSEQLAPIMGQGVKLEFIKIDGFNQELSLRYIRWALLGSRANVSICFKLIGGSTSGSALRLVCKPCGNEGRFLSPTNFLFITDQSNLIMADYVVPLSSDELHMVCKIDWMSNRIRAADFEVETEFGQRPDPTWAAPTSTRLAPACGTILLC
jgi:hypothetical protein